MQRYTTNTKSYLIKRTAVMLLITHCFSLGYATTKTKGIEPAMVVAETKVTDCYQNFKKNKGVNLPKPDQSRFEDREERTFTNQCLKLAYDEIRGLISAPQVQYQLLELVKQQEEQTEYLDFYMSVLPYNSSFCHMTDLKQVFQEMGFSSSSRQPTSQRQWVDDLATGCLRGANFTDQISKMMKGNQHLMDAVCEHEDFKLNSELCGQQIKQ